MSAIEPQLVLGPLLRYVGTSTATVWVETDAAATVEVLGPPGEHVPRRTGTTTPSSWSRTSSPARPRRTTCGSTGAASGRPPTAGPSPRSERASGSGRRGSSSARAASARPSARRTRCRPTEHPQGIGSRCAVGLRAAPAAGVRRLAGRAGPDGRPGLRRRGAARDARVHPRAPGRRRAAGRVGRRLRGVHPALPRVVVRPRHPLAAVDGAVDDDLRRPRGQRRLEHLAGLGRRDARAAVVGRPDHRRLHVVLGLPAPRQPLAAGAGRGGDVRRRCSSDDDAGPRLREFARKWDRESAASRWAYYRDFGRLAAARDRLAGRSRAQPTDGGTWSTPRSGTGSPSMPAAPSTTWSSSTTLPVVLPHGIHHLEAWNEAVCAGRWGSLAARLGERLRRAVDLEHWAAFNRRSSSSSTCCASVSAASAASRRRRSPS